MFELVAWTFLALKCVSWPSVIVAQSTAYHFTSGVTSPAPVPGKPFTLTWTGGESTETVYIILNYLFPDTPDQNIVYMTTDILSNAPNNGSWTYNVPLDIQPGRYTFSIGQNPFLLSDSTGVFSILPSQTSYVPAGSSTSNTASYQTYNGCGLPPLPDYTYTGYQPPCTSTVDGVVETLYPIVPSSDSSSFFGIGPFGSATAMGIGSKSPSSPISASSAPFNTAFASGVFAQALQCPTSVTPTTTKITASGTTTIFSLVGCSSASGSTSDVGGVCHSSGYTTFAVSGTSSVCCPTGWATTPLNFELFCVTSIGQDAKRAVVEERQISTETLVASPNPLVAISGLAFTMAGVVTNEAAVATRESSSSENTATAASAGATSSGGRKLITSIWRTLVVMAATGVLCHLYD